MTSNCEETTDRISTTDITNETETESRITLSESPEAAFKDDASPPRPKSRRKSLVQSAQNLVRNKVFPQKLPPIKRTKSKKMNKIESEPVPTPRATLSDGFEVTWRNLSYFVENTTFPCIPVKKSIPSVRVILKCLSGSFKSSELTAVMGPSGAGKSTLLACVCGKRSKGITGDIHITGCDRIKVAIITQNDYLTDKFTLKEALIFASKAKNTSKKVDHEEVINNVVNSLCLESSLGTRLGNCSGGQRRRVSIALELVSSPNILILDEPTSGLDSTSCFQIIETLKELTQHKKNPMAIVATIHQPSAKVFNMFSNVYVISHNGQCIYHGSPDELVPHLSRLHLSVPEYHNPADFIAEIASGEHGEESITKLATFRKQSFILIESNLKSTKSTNNLSNLSQKNNYPIVFHTVLLISRAFKLIVREPHLSWIRLGVGTITALFLRIIFGHEVGQVSGCPPREEKLFSDNPSELFKDFDYEHKKINENLGSIFFNCVYLMFGGILPMIMIFPNEFNVIIKQYTNGWYSTIAYYISKVFTDLPVIISAVTIYLTLWYVLTSQIDEFWRYLIVIYVGVLTMMIGQSQGVICSALFSTNPTTASYVAIITNTPFFLLSGYLVRTKRIPSYLRPLTAFSYSKYFFESVVIVLYGYDRCWYPESNQTLSEPRWLQFLKTMTASMIDSKETEIDYYEDSAETDRQALNDILSMFSGTTVNDRDGPNKYQSVVMSQLEFTDDMLPYNILILTLIAIAMQFSAYFVILFKLRKSQ